MTEREIKTNLNQLVVHQKTGVKYRLTGGIIRRKKDTGQYWYQGELQDLKAEHSVMICRLEDIEICKE